MNTTETITPDQEVKEVRKKLVEYTRIKNREPNCFFANYLREYWREKLVMALTKQKQLISSDQ